MSSQRQDMTESASTTAPSRELITLERWSGPVSVDDPNANFKREVALYANVAPLTTLNGLSQAVGLSVGALAHFILARYASSGSAGLLEIGPEMVTRLKQPIDLAEVTGTTCARLDAYDELRHLISWLSAALPDNSSPGLVATQADTTQPPGN
jgi:hypothetical protein